MAKQCVLNMRYTGLVFLVFNSKKGKSTNSMYTEFFFYFVNINKVNMLSTRPSQSSVTKKNASVFLSIIFPHAYEGNIEVSVGHGLSADSQRNILDLVQTITSTLVQLQPYYTIQCGTPIKKRLCFYKKERRKRTKKMD